MPRQENTKVSLPEMNRDEVREAVENNAVLLVPVATIEQHGPHAPLHTDIDNVNEILLEAARRTNPEPRVLVSAPVWFSPSPFDVEKFPGCVGIKKETFARVLRELLETFIRGGFKKIVVVNGHGGGTEQGITRVIYSMRNERKSVIWPDWEIPAETQVTGFFWVAFLGEFAREELKKLRRNPPGSDMHAGDIETSLQLYLRPELVDMKKARKGAICKIGRFYSGDVVMDYQRRLIIDAYYPPVIPGEAEEGIWGDPTLASKELGEDIFNLTANKIAEFIQEFASK